MAYTVTDVGCEERFGADDQVVVRTFQVTPWSARGEFYADILGGVRLKGDRLYRQLPARDPDFPWLFAQGTSCKPIEEDYGTSGSSDNVLTKRPTYIAASISVTYKPLPNDMPDPGQGGNESGGPGNQSSSNSQQEMDLATMSWDFSVRNLKLPNQWFKWQIAGDYGPEPLVNQDVSATKTYPGIQLVMTRHLVARLPMRAITGQLGRVNEAPIRLAGNEYDVETVRFDSAKVSRKVTSQGFKFFEISYTFSVQPIFDYAEGDESSNKMFVGWNRLFDPKRGFWRRVANIATGHGIYDSDTAGPLQKLGGREVGGFDLLFHPQAA